MAVEVGAVVDGKVTGVQPFGCFVELPDGQNGLVHISEIANEYVKSVQEHVKPGQSVKVKILSVSDNGKISLSIKQAAPPRAPKPKKTVPAKDEPLVLSDYEWKPRNLSSDAESFEEKMKRFKSDSDEKMQSLKNNEGRGKGYRRSSNSY